MFKIDSMQLVCEDSQDGLVLTWLPGGLKLEMSKTKVCYHVPLIYSIIEKWMGEEGKGGYFHGG